ncbi:MAG: zinc-ribbon domain containing protein [Candidatus Eremiobacteraeota bacterium]|nr:zinc-ribbon domain containing protein [Candidatus Eremiobacteraeota bacterium]MBV8284865.1 zinc-ribbon domain containing protein [Candidatus Eremiobacteraeota bacterium]MBV8435585.1 zinc-ribbon domain containing protein [Candidatus Eremiobacteraeota bacterium]
MEDRVLTCKDCAAEFVFSAREQQFFADKGFTNQPQRCRDCRQARRAHSGDSSAPRANARPSFEAVCAACGIETTVPFRPRGDRPVYCRSCFSAQVPVTV